MRYRWRVEKKYGDEEVREFSERLNMPIPLTEVMLNRGVKDIDQARAYLKPQWMASLPLPFSPMCSGT